MNIKSCKLVVRTSENSTDKNLEERPKNLEQVTSNKVRLSVWPSNFLGGTLFASHFIISTDK